MIRKATCRAALAAALSIPAHAATTITYEDAVLGAQGYLNNTPYTAAGATHSNSFTDWGGGFTSWDGFAISNHTNTTLAGYGNQYSSYTGGGAGGSAQFAVGYVSSSTSTKLTFNTIVDFTGKSAHFTNTTYAVLDMMNGSSFNENTRGFGGTSGNDPDFLKLTITGYLNNVATGSTELYLADYSFADNTQDYILKAWTPLSFTPLGTAVNEIRFAITASDVATPTYFAMDNLLVPETSTLGLAALAGLNLLRRRRPERRVQPAS